MTDTEIYIDGHATAHFRDMNESLEKQRLALIGQHQYADGDLYSETLLAAQVRGRRFFSAMSRIRHGTPFFTIYAKPMSMTLKARRISPSQKKMALEIQKALKSPGDHLAKIWKVIFNLLDIDFDKLTADEQKVLKKVLSKSPVIKNNPLNFRRRGKK